MKETIKFEEDVNENEWIRLAEQEKRKFAHEERGKREFDREEQRKQEFDDEERGKQ
jgi:hypothetical protein